jgi:hypothetical protein
LIDDLRFEFGSPEWTARIRQAFEEAITGAAEISFSISERYTDPPPRLAPADGALGWTCSIDGGTIAFSSVPSDDADVVVVADYESILPLVRLTQSDINASPELAARLVAEGRLLVKTRRRAPTLFNGIHDVMAAVTA